MGTNLKAKTRALGLTLPEFDVALEAMDAVRWSEGDPAVHETARRLSRKLTTARNKLAKIIEPAIDEA